MEAQKHISETLKKLFEKTYQVHDIRMLQYVDLLLYLQLLLFNFLLHPHYCLGWLSSSTQAG